MNVETDHHQDVFTSAADWYGVKKDNEPTPNAASVEEGVARSTDEETLNRINKWERRPSGWRRESLFELGRLCESYTPERQCCTKRLYPTTHPMMPPAIAPATLLDE